MTAEGLSNWLRIALHRGAPNDVGMRSAHCALPPDGIEIVSDFRAAGILTANAGIVITTRDGDEFQVTIVQTHYGYGGLGRHA